LGLRFLLFWGFRLGQVGKGFGGGGAGQLHAQLFQLCQQAQVTRGAGGGFFQLDGWGGVQGS
jgi:hypothetical protein